MLLLQAICFLVLPPARAFGLFALLGALVYLAYGGGFGTMPATAADYFGTAHAGAVYGAMIIVWSIGGVIGPLVTAWLYEVSGHGYTLPFTVLALVALLAVALPVTTRMPAEPALYRGGVTPVARH
ncbi:MFS transporter [Planosporangium sp. 12N6]|uniref:MFS transporter n=1 Tax=Planosporangium spinosum TaxID=3402278 RepID=UPI003CF886A9